MTLPIKDRRTVMLEKMDNNDCDHIWVANSGTGGEPRFRRNRSMSHEPLMHVKCSGCNSRAWLSENDWDAMLESTVPEAQPDDL